MKQWVLGSWSGKRSDDFGSSVERCGSFPAVDIFAFLKAVQKIEKKHGEIRNIQVAWRHEKSSGTGQDYDPGYYEYWIQFERLETDEEEVRRNKSEEKEAANKEKAEAARQKEEKALLKELLAKYGG